MEISLNLFETMALAALVFYIGKYLREKVKVLSKYCIPAPVIGGILFSIVVFILKLTTSITITIDTTLQNLFMTTFFASIGFTASFRMLKSGGIKVVMFLGIAILLVVSQDILGAALAKVFGLNPLLGLCTGSISMVGGHGTAGAFGPMLEEMGVTGATTVAFASATFGLVCGCFIGGYVAKSLIERKKLVTPQKSENKSVPLSDFHEDNSTNLCYKKITRALSFLFIAMGAGSFISKFIQETGLTFPSYIGAMIAAAIIRNISDIKNFDIEEAEIEVIGNVSLTFFLCLALMALRLWELLDLAGPLVVMLIAQGLFMGLFAYFITFNVMGRNYDAAVFASANCGFGMGATPNAVANMDALTAKFGFAPTPYFVVPIVGALFVDFVNSAVITLFINLLA